MALIVVAEAARRLGVGVSRVHQRIADGSLPAVRIGSQWAIDESALHLVSDLNKPGRPLSRRSALALIAASQPNGPGVDCLAPVERLRTRARLLQLLEQSSAGRPVSEASVRATAALLRVWLRNRADRCLYCGSPRDLPDLRGDGRVVLSGLSHPRSGIASGDLVEAYIDNVDVAAVVEDYLLTPVAVDHDANVVFHVVASVPEGGITTNAPLQLAADLAEYRRPREEARATEILGEIASEYPDLLAAAPGSPDSRRKGTA